MSETRPELPQDLAPKVQEESSESKQSADAETEEPDDAEQLTQIESRASSSRRSRADDSKTMYKVLFTTSFNTDLVSFEKIQDRYRIAVARTAGCNLSVVRVVNIHESVWDFGTKHAIQVETEVIAYGRRAATIIAQRLNLLDFTAVLEEQVS